MHVKNNTEHVKMKFYVNHKMLCHIYIYDTMCAFKLSLGASGMFLSSFFQS